ncbi:MAG TPA: hypothetical protein VGB14_18520 [Acidimicrobiales bacterium]|jgi:enamine deaminase RidA (YjgF/YER057c/UK114 family)
MSDTPSDWKQVADSLAGLGMKLKLHFEQASGEEGQEEQDRARQALDRLGEAVEGAFEAVRNAVKDPAVKDDVRDVASTLKQAVTNTLADARRRAQDR